MLLQIYTSWVLGIKCVELPCHAASPQTMHILKLSKMCLEMALFLLLRAGSTSFEMSHVSGTMACSQQIDRNSWQVPLGQTHRHNLNLLKFPFWPFPLLPMGAVLGFHNDPCTSLFTRLSLLLWIHSTSSQNSHPMIHVLSHSDPSPLNKPQQ